ncbi:arylalkylamine N-acetyltransferase 1 [Schistocerca piceifrons]|uniref:arylalkylamine N-acetyltransferase 1 n=1 Tax=Schistocerca piceifrons TaxID=274613 RepID=UPI001F5F9EAC|nr:arylalkylamine N-acetyltransferase 1 [Schistocerca piceifrons]
MASFPGIDFSPIPEARYDDVIKHLRDNFFADEPLNCSVRLCQPGEPHAELEEHALSTLRDRLSWMAMDTDTGQVVGVALNGVSRRGDLAEAQERLAAVSDDKFRTIFGLLYGVNRRLDLFTAHGVDQIFECRILSVDSRYRGRGLARRLLQLSEGTARERGFKVLKEDATGLFSQRVAESLGLQTACQVRYCDYTAEDTGEVVFHTPQPHDCLKIMVKVLD